MASVTRVECLKFNVPFLFADKYFALWLAEGSGCGVATWHAAHAKPGETSDVFVTYDGGKGSDAPSGGMGMPAPAWAELCRLVCQATGVKSGYYLLWLTNLEE